MVQRETLGRRTDTGDVPRLAPMTPIAVPPAPALWRRAPQRARGRAFSLIEVVMVAVILAAIAAIAVPRLSRGSQGSVEAAMARDVQVLQKAIDLYAAEHHGAFPNGEMIVEQLTQYSDGTGAMSKTKAPPYTFGPYVRKIPPVPMGPNKGSSHISTTAGVGVGWIYDPTEGTITPNMTELSTDATSNG